MLKELALTNFVIAKSCKIPFAAGFNVLSGETGAGKTMLLHALSLLLGQKADVKLISKGQDKALITTVFTLPSFSPVFSLLQEQGIEIDSDENLCVIREISTSGKNKILINAQPANLPLLKTIAPYLVETISQHSQLSLKNPDIQRELLDEYGSLNAEKAAYERIHLQEQEVLSALKELEKQKPQMVLDYPRWKDAYEEIEKAAFKVGEEEVLFREYHKISHFQDLCSLGTLVLSYLSEEPSSISHQLNHLHKTLGKMVKLDTELTPLESMVATVAEQLSEVSFELTRYLENLETSPQSFKTIEDRLSLLKTLKRKYGQTLEEIEAYKNTLAGNILAFEEFDTTHASLRKQHEELLALKTAAAQVLSGRRISSAALLSEALTIGLQALNMPDAKIKIDVEPTTSSISGCDKISFSLAANGGDDFYNIQDHASGGELSRILFTLKLILVEKQRGKTLIFDEIDANIGGITASILGKKLRKLGESRQVICITHFPQVAACADHHLQIIKTAVDGKASTEIKVLSEEDKKEELVRMLGGTTELFTSHSFNESVEKS